MPNSAPVAIVTKAEEQVARPSGHPTLAPPQPLAPTDANTKAESSAIFSLDTSFPVKSNSSAPAVPPLPPVAPKTETAKQEMPRAWSEEIQVLERENQALRERLHINETDKLSDIKIDAVSQIHEEVLRAKLNELEKTLDKLNMKKGDILPQKIVPNQSAGPQ